MMLSKMRREIENRLRSEYGDMVQPFSLTQAKEFAQVDAEEYIKDYYNYHANILESMFWSGASDAEIDKYMMEHGL